MEKGGESILVGSSNHLRLKFLQLADSIIQLQAFHSAVAEITKTTVSLECLGMQLPVDQWLITQLQKSDSGNEKLEETWVGYVMVWLLSNVVCKDDTP